MSECYLPSEVMMDIFTRLEVKTLLGIRCVCKSWYHLINDQHFHTLWFAHKTHLNTINNSSSLLLIKHYSQHEKQELFSLHFDDDSLTPYPLNLKTNCPVASFYPYLTMIGSCNGLVCVADDVLKLGDCSVYLWNPIVGKFVVVPMPRITFWTPGEYDRALGFGFDYVTNDYKVVRVVYPPDRSGLEMYSGSTEVDIYSLREGVWRNISVSGDHVPRIRSKHSQAFLNGAIHWVSREAWKYPVFIVLFNLGTEVFSQMELPASLRHGVPSQMSLGVFHDLLCVFYEMSIWVMKEYGVLKSWTNLYNLDSFGLFSQSVRVIGLRRNGGVLLTKDEQLISADTKGNPFEYLGIRGWDASYSVSTYTESLVLIDKTMNCKKNDRKRRTESIQGSNKARRSFHLGRHVV